MKIIKNIALLTALSMPFAALAWEWSDVCKKTAKSCEFIGRLSGTISLGMFAYWAGMMHTSFHVFKGYLEQINNLKNPEDIAFWTARMNEFNQKATKNENNIRNIVLISFAIFITAYKGKSFLESSFF